MESLHLRKFSLAGFKNYAQAEMVFSPGFNCISGRNGEGKTNLLDAIYYLSFTKSHFNPIDSQNILHGSQLFVIQGEFAIGKKVDEVFCAQKKGERKQVKVNKKEAERFADHVGSYPVVMASPADIELIYEGSEVRRKFADSIISQYDKEYLEDVIAYAKVLMQRNAQLKQFSRSGKFELESLKVWDPQLIALGCRIFEKRKKFSQQLEPVFQRYYEQISGSREKVGIAYRSQLGSGDFEALLNEAIEKDRVTEFTTVGVHKDDWEFTMDGYPVKKFASQGQQKSYLLAIRLAQFDFVKDHCNIVPVLLLDDIRDKLDEQRVKRLVDLVSSDDFGQVFITDTAGEQLRLLLKGLKKEQKMFIVEEGSVKEHSG